MEPGAETLEVWSQMHDQLLSYIRRQVATFQDAEDILQEVFVRIHANLHRLKDTQSITAWIYRIARNAVTDYYRERAKAADAIKTLAENGDGAEQPSSGPDPAGDETNEPGAAIAGCTQSLVERLSEPYREAVTLTELEGVSQVEAARKLGLSVSGMKSRVQRGREKLKELLLGCCHVELDRRREVIDYEPRDGRVCDEECDCH